MCNFLAKFTIFAEPRVTILGNGDVHANQGSKVVLKCKISGTLQKPAYIFW